MSKSFETSRAPEPTVESAGAMRTELLSDNRLAARLRGFGPLGILAIFIILAGNAIVISLSGILVLVWARLSHTPWREIGYVRPKSWLGSLAIGLVFGIAFK